MIKPSKIFIIWNPSSFLFFFTGFSTVDHQPTNFAVRLGRRPTKKVGDRRTITPTAAVTMEIAGNPWKNIKRSVSLDNWQAIVFHIKLMEMRATCVPGIDAS